MRTLTRTVLLRLFGLVVVAALAVAATSLLSHGLRFDVAAIDSPIRWLATTTSRSLDPGWAILGGAAVLTLAAGAGVLMLARPRRARVALDRTSAGTSWLDLDGLARVVRRRLRAEIDPQIHVVARRRALTVVVPTHTGEQPLDVVHQVAVSMPETLGRIGAGGIRFAVVTGKSTKRRVQ